FFPSTQSYLYADQADLDPVLGTPTSPLDTLVLMYDECGLTTRFGPDEYFLVSFKTVEVEGGAEALKHYAVHIFTDGTIIFLENGKVQPPGRAAVAGHMRGKVGFGPSPNCAFDHVIAEFQIPLTVAGGGSYSPDPLFWNSDPPPPKCPKETINVPVMVNVLNNVLTSDGAIQDMVRGANQILAPAGMCADVSPVNI